MKAFDLLLEWPVDSVAAAAIGPLGTTHRHGPTNDAFALASVTKLFTAAGIHLAIEEGSIAIDDELGALIEGDQPRGATVADVLAHAGGLGPKGDILDDPGRRRIYSNGGYELLANLVEQSTGISFAEYLSEGIFEPLGMSTTQLLGSAAHAGWSTVEDLLRFVNGLPALLAPSTVSGMTNPYLPELIGVLPGYGRQTPNVWGLGPEIRGDKSPHWTGSANSPRTWGHFGQAGTFVWVDPSCSVTLIALTNRRFGEWALQRWPEFADAVREEVS